MKQLFRIIRFIWSHPLASRNRPAALKKFFGWQIGQRINNHPMLYPFVEDSVLLVEKGMAGATGNIYTGLLEFEDMAFVLHVLRDEDLFGDIGANVGAYSILASKNAGSRTIAVEPIPATSVKLRNNIELNGVAGLVKLCVCGVGETKGVLKFTATIDTINHVLSDSEIAVAPAGSMVEVPVQTLDELFAERAPEVMKMDVEGFEWPALQGAPGLLGSSSLKAIVIELNGTGERYGYSDKKIEELLSSYGFESFSYEPFSRSLKRAAPQPHGNVLYIKDAEWASRRCAESRKYTIMGQKV